MGNTPTAVADRDELRRRLLARRGITPAGTRPPQIPRRGTDTPGTPAPLSHAQERMWFFHRLDPAASAYNVCVLWRLDGTLDPAVLRAAFDRICARHEVLRTLYPADENGVPRQVVLERLDPMWSETDLRHLSGDAQEHALRQLAHDAGREPFDLTALSPLRLVLVRLGADRHALVMVAQHINWDGPSFGIFSRELSTAYADLLAGRPDSLPPLPVQYADVAAWHRERWGTRPDPGQLEYWRQQFDPLPEPVDIPIDHERPATVTEDGGWRTHWLDPALTGRLVALGAGAGATPFMVLVAGIATLLGRYAQADEVTIGTVAQNRDHPALAGLIGNLGNTVPLRVDLTGRPAFRELLGRVRAVCTGAYANADVPFDLLLDELRVQRRLDRNPLFDVTVIFLAQDLAGPTLPGLDVRWEKFHNGTTQTDLSFDAVLLDGRLGLQATYRTSLFRDDTVRRMLCRLAGILEQAVADPDRPLDRFDLLLPDETRGVARGPAGGSGTVVELFEAQVRRDPAADALADERRVLSFGEVDAAANRLARLLVAHGVGPEVRVGIALPRTAEAIVTMLAVFKAGGAYVPLDPAYPPEHLARVLTDAAPAVVVAAPGVSLPGGPWTVLHTDDARLAPGAGLSAEPPRVPVDPAHPAYVIYTSGSTGRPKGVLVTHANLVNLFHSHRADLYDEARRRTRRDRLRVGHAWSFSFDASWQPQLWLLDGHCVHVLAYETYADPRALAAAVAAGGFDFIELTPTLLEETLRWLDPRDVPAVLGFGGEAVAPQLWASLGAHGAAFNLYGPTESTVDSLIARAEPGSGPAVGGPVAGARVTVLDAALRPVPPGVPGELYVGGAGLARGYLDRADLTAERFVADAYGPPGSRAYRTGDLVRWRADGRLEFLGRIDDQVKIRGFRVEPAEVEGALQRVCGDRQVTVAVREDSPGARRLVGYVVDPDRELDLADLRRALAADLPEHLVPSALVALDRLPLMPNGKLNRRALPAPVRGEHATRAPRTPVEEQFCALFAELLGLPEVGIDDGFFELGGDSILSIQLVSRAARAGWTIRPRDVFACRTVAALAEVAEPLLPAAGPATAERTGTFPATPIMRWLDERAGRVDRYPQTLTVTVPADLTLQRLTAGLQSVLDAHDALRIRWDAAGAAVQPAVDAARCVRAGTGDADEDTRAAAARLDLAAGILVQAVLRGPGRLLLVVHHIAIDGVSWRVLLPDLEAACAGRELDPVPVPFRQWALGQAAHATAAAADAGAWRAVLGTGEPSLGLDPARDTVATARVHTVRLPAADTAALLTEVPAAFRAGVEDVLLAALAIALREWRGGVGLVDVEGHGRDGTEDLSRTVGWFTTIAPVRLDTGDTADPLDAAVWRGGRATAQVVERVRDGLRAGPADRRGWGLLRHLDAEHGPALAGLPSPQIGFNYLGRFGTGGPDRPWAPVPRLDNAAAVLDPAVPFAHAVELNALVEDHPGGPRLVATWAWPAGLELDVPALARSWTAALHAVAAPATRAAAGRRPRDFPLVALTQETLDALPPAADILPLTPLQETMLAACRRDPQVYVTHVSFDLPSTVDPAAVRANAEALLHRYPNLAARFAGTAPTVQIIPPSVRLPWREVRVDTVPEAAALQAADQVTPMDPGTGPLLRFTLLRIPGRAPRLLLAGHHLLLDGWSVPILLRELLGGAREPVAASFRDVLVADRDPRRHADAVRGWADVLSGVDGPTLVAPGAAGRPGRARDHELVVAEPLTAALAGYARRAGVTLNTVVQVAWARALQRHTGRADVVFGASVSGRSRAVPGIERVVGLCLGTVPVRVRFDGAPLDELVARVGAQQAVLADAAPVRLDEVAGPGGAPFDTLLVYENFPGRVDAWPADVPEPTGIVWRDSPAHPVVLFAYPGPSMRLRLAHRPGWVDGPAAAALGRDLVAALTTMAGER